ncbi:MAG: DUF1559 domain-containing protein [Phycisphaerales bacterium]|nr:DUF1559 domain-containing protein [Phycisphaerales bacterium]
MPVVMVTNRKSIARFCGDRSPRRTSAFTLIDLLVSIAIIALLISILLPSLTNVREATRRVVCSSNARQIGLGIAMYAEDQKTFPFSAYEPKQSDPDGAPQLMHFARSSDPGVSWDGLGLLYVAEYLNAPQVFYCPSHRGTNPFSRFAASWSSTNDVKIVTNFHYRGTPWSLAAIDRPALLSDSLASQRDFSHQIGANILRSDFSVGWVSDPARRILVLLPASELDVDRMAARRVSEAWGEIDSRPAQTMRP